MDMDMDMDMDINITMDKCMQYYSNKQFFWEIKFIASHYLTRLTVFCQEAAKTIMNNK